MAKRKYKNGDGGVVKRKRSTFYKAPRARATFATELGESAIEYKFHDLDVDDAVIAAGATIAKDSVLTIIQGVSESQRIGRKCTVRGINWRFRLTLASTAVAGSTSDIVRVMLYVDKQTNGAAATATDILATADFQSFNNLSNKGRFLVLMDRTYALSAQAGSGRGATDTLSYGETAVVDSYYKRCSIPIEYTAGTGAIAEMPSNNVGVLLLSQSGQTGFASKMRIRFTG